MKKRKKIILIIILLPVVLGIIYPFLGALFGVDLYRAITLKSRLNKFIYHTNHQVFLQECRQLIKDGYKGNYYFTWIDRHPDAAKFPKDIHNLKPTYVYLNEDGMIIELLGGQSHCRVIAYSEQFDKDISGEKKLIDGLWLYSDFLHFELWDVNTT